MTATSTPSTVDLILAETPHLRLVARRLARCEASAEDDVQNTLLKAFAARDRFRVGSSIRAWTSTILRRVFLTRALGEKRRRTRTATDCDEPTVEAACRAETPTRGPSDDLAGLADELDDGLRAALARLPEKFRRAFFLHAVHEMSCAEIARNLAIPEGTVMSRIHRARTRLKLELGPRRRALRAAAAS